MRYLQLLIRNSQEWMEIIQIVFLRCLLRVRAETETLGTAEITGISRMERCAESICAENQQHLQPYCRRL